MLREWLRCANRPTVTYSRFEVEDAAEASPPSDSVKTHLSDLIRDSSINPAFLEDVTRKLGWDKARLIIRQRLPRSLTLTRGRFGEVLGVFMLRDLMGYLVPIEKAHFTITGGQSQPSTDAVLLKVDGDSVTEVCFVESKLRTRADNFAAVEGARQLRDDYKKEMPDMLLFTAARLHERADPLYAPLMRYMASRDDVRDRDSFRLLLFYDSTIWSEQCLTNLSDDEPEVSPLRVLVARLGELAGLVEETYSRVGLSVADDEPQ
jgi:hypothetical protein